MENSTAEQKSQTAPNFSSVKSLLMEADKQYNG